MEYEKRTATVSPRFALPAAWNLLVASFCLEPGASYVDLFVNLASYVLSSLASFHTTIVSAAIVGKLYDEDWEGARGDVIAALLLYCCVAVLLQGAATTGERLRWRMRGALAIKLHRGIYDQAGFARAQSKTTIDSMDSKVPATAPDFDQRATSDLDDFCRLLAQRLFSSNTSQGGIVSTLVSAGISLQYVAQGVGGARTVGIALAFATASASVAWLLLSPVASLSAAADRAMGQFRFAWDRATRQAEEVVLAGLGPSLGSRLEGLAGRVAARRMELASWMVASGTWSGLQASYPWVLCYACIALGVQHGGMFVSCSGEGSGGMGVGSMGGEYGGLACAGALRGLVRSQALHGGADDAPCTASAADVASAAAGAAYLIGALCALPGLLLGLGPTLGAAVRVRAVLDVTSAGHGSDLGGGLDSGVGEGQGEGERAGLLGEERGAEDAGDQLGAGGPLGGRKAAAALSMTGVSVKAGGKLLCQNVSVELGYGEVLLVTGPSGCGKTSLLRAIAGNKAGACEGTIGGTVFEGRSRGVSGVTSEDARRRSLGRSVLLLQGTPYVPPSTGEQALQYPAPVDPAIVRARAEPQGQWQAMAGSLPGLPSTAAATAEALLPAVEPYPCCCCRMPMPCAPGYGCGGTGPAEGQGGGRLRDPLVHEERRGGERGGGGSSGGGLAGCCWSACRSLRGDGIAGNYLSMARAMVIAPEEGDGDRCGDTQGTGVGVTAGASADRLPASYGGGRSGQLNGPDTAGYAGAQRDAVTRALQALDLSLSIQERLLGNKDYRRAPVDWHSQLSAGELQRVAVARLLLRRPPPRLLLADEALGAQDDEGLRACARALREVGCTVVLVTHQEDRTRQALVEAGWEQGQVKALQLGAMGTDATAASSTGSASSHGEHYDGATRKGLGYCAPAIETCSPARVPSLSAGTGGLAAASAAPNAHVAPPVSDRLPLLGSSGETQRRPASGQSSHDGSKRAGHAGGCVCRGCFEAAAAGVWDCGALITLGLPIGRVSLDWLLLALTFVLEVLLALVSVTKAFVVGDALQAIVELRFHDFWAAFWVGTGTYALAAALNAGSQSLGAAVSARWFRRVTARVHRTIAAPGSHLLPVLARGTQGQDGSGAGATEGAEGQGTRAPGALHSGVTSEGTGTGAGAGGESDGLDQRAAQDTDRAGHLLGVALWGARGRVSLVQVCTGLLSAAVAASRLSGLAVLLCVLFALAALALARCLLQPVPQAVWEVRRREGVLRRGHARARDRADAVAGLGGEQWERDTADARMASLLAAAHSLVLLETPARLAALVAARGGTGIAYAFTAVAAAAAAQGAAGGEQGRDEEGTGRMSLASLYALSSLLISLNLYMCALPDYLASAAELMGVGARVLQLVRRCEGCDECGGEGGRRYGGGYDEQLGADVQVSLAAPDAVHCGDAIGGQAAIDAGTGPIELEMQAVVAGHAMQSNVPAVQAIPGVARLQRNHQRLARPLPPGPVSLQACRGEWWRVSGRNGAGKTTLLHCIAGLRRAASGSIRVPAREGALSTAVQCSPGPVAWLGPLPYIPEGVPLALALAMGTGRRAPSSLLAGVGAGAGAGAGCGAVSWEEPDEATGEGAAGCMGCSCDECESCCEACWQWTSSVEEGGAGPGVPIGVTSASLYPVDVAEMERVLEAVGLESLARQLGRSGDWHSQLSAGELQRVAVARLLLRSPPPRLLLADEAWSALDGASRGRVLEALRGLGAAVLWVEHGT